MKYLLHSPLLTIYFFLLLIPAVQAQDEAGWIMRTKDTANYHAVSMANGMIGIVVSKKALSENKVILNGVYDVSGETGSVPTFLESINFTNVNIDIENGSPDKNITNWEQVLNMKEGTMNTSFDQDQKLKVEHTIVALRHLPNIGLITFRLTALEDCKLLISNSHTIPAKLKPLGNFYKEDHLPATFPLLTTMAETPSGKYKIAATSTFIFEKDTPIVIHENRSVRKNEMMFHLNLKKGQIYNFSIIGSITSTASVQDVFNESIRMSLFAHLEGKDKLMTNHRKAWDKLWQSDVIIDGDLKAQQDIHMTLFMLYSFVREGSGYSIPPMGLSAFGYGGHIFWDCELWMYPGILVMHPALAKNLLDYRFNRLEKAKQNAIAHGYKGAMFPWESADAGEEVTPTWALTGPFEHHITACVGIAFWNYYRVTKDNQWLKEKGFPVLKEIADFWVSRSEKNAAGEYEIKNVVGADEYAENVDNNAFTNGAAIVVLRYAVQAAKQLGVAADPLWAEVAAKMRIPKFANGVTKEYETYKEGKQVKQLDVNLLAFPLELITDPVSVKKDLDYYLPLIDPEGPAMSHSILSVISSRQGNCKKASELFKSCYVSYQRPPYGVLAETASGNNPYFSTAAGGMLQSVLFGLGGLELTDNGIVQLKSCLPEGWRSMKIVTEGKTFTVK